MKRQQCAQSTHMICAQSKTKSTFVLLGIAVAAFVSSSTATSAEPDNTNEPSRKKVGLALGGGGMRGACHIGVLRALKREGIPVDVISGTSMGAIVGGLYCADVPLDQIEELLTSGRLAKSMASGAPVARLPGMVCGKNTEGLFAGKHMVRAYTKLIPKERRTIENLNRPFSAVVVNLLDGKESALTSGDLSTAMRASSAVPLLCQPLRTKDGVFVDGGVLNNLPVAHAKELGADYVIAVEIDAAEKVEDRETRTFPEVADRVMGLMLRKIDNPERAHASVTLRPDVAKVNFLSLRKSEIQEAIAAGDRAAMAAMPEIKRLLGSNSSDNGAIVAIP